MKQELETKVIPLTKKELEGVKQEGVEMLKELEQERKDGLITDEVYRIFKKGLQGVAKGEVIKVV